MAIHFILSADISTTQTVSQNNYPETMGKFYIVSHTSSTSNIRNEYSRSSIPFTQINAPWAFKTVWGFVKPWLDEVTVSKIDILSSDYVKTLAQQIPLENLPKFLGGKCECAGGCTLSNAGPWQDKELVQRVLQKKKDEKAQANGGVKKEETPAAAAAPATAEKQGSSAPAAAPATSEPAPPIPAAAVETPLPAASTPASSAAAPAIDNLSEALSQVKMTVVESKVDG